MTVSESLYVTETVRPRQPYPGLLIGGKWGQPFSLPSSEFSRILPCSLILLQLDNIEVVILLGVEGTHVCNPHFLLEQTRLKTLSSFLEATRPQKIKEHAMDQAPEGTEIPPSRMSTSLPVPQGSLSSWFSTVSSHRFLDKAIYSREDKEAQPRTPD